MRHVGITWPLTWLVRSWWDCKPLLLDKMHTAVETCGDMWKPGTSWKTRKSECCKATSAISLRAKLSLVDVKGSNDNACYISVWEARFSECVHRENCLPTFWVHVIFDDWTICSCLMVLLNDWLCITFFGDIGNILLRELASLSPRLGGYKLPPAAILSRQSLNKECNSSCTYLHTHMV